MPPEPTRFSITNCWPRWFESHSPMMRATMSFGPQAAKPTTQCTGLLGYLACADAVAGNATQKRQSSCNSSERTMRITLSLDKGMMTRVLLTDAMSELPAPPARVLVQLTPISAMFDARTDRHMHAGDIRHTF